MAYPPRIGLQIGPGDPFWVQVREVVWQRARSLPLEVVEVDIPPRGGGAYDEQMAVVEDLHVQDLDALIGNALPGPLLTEILAAGIPVVYLPETPIRHPRLTSRHGLDDAGRLLGTFLAGRIAGGAVLVLSGHDSPDDEDSSRSRLAGFLAALPADGRFSIHQVRSDWSYADGRAQVADYLAAQPQLALAAIYGLSDSLALAARDACAALGRLAPATVILGINGDPLALAAIAAGRMAATVETDVVEISTQAMDLAYRAARGEAIPSHFRPAQRLVTAETIAAVATRKLITLADLPTRLVGVNRRQEQQRVVQLETSLAINRQIGLILDEQQLSLAITSLIRDNYHFDEAQFLIWNADAGRLVEVSTARRDACAAIVPDPAGPSAQALTQDHIVCIPAVQASQRFAPDPAWPETQARVVVPVHLGGQIVGLLDLHNRRTTHRTWEELAGLQVLADQLGIALRNAELYGQALAARELAEKADRLKTGLLANVSHELRTPLNVILGYSREALAALAASQGVVPAGLGDDLAQVYRSGEHLRRLINDLLDLSRAEIDELDLVPEQIDSRAFLEEIFRTSAEHFGSGGAVAWRLALPPALPPLVADPVRLRQVLLNLLDNAHKFTAAGQITLGAEAGTGELHLWVADTGVGIPDAQQAQIFEPFIHLDTSAGRRDGIGLGLSIARRLVMLHGGRLTVESRPDQGSTFHVYLPLPVAPAPPGPQDPAVPASLLLIADSELPPPALIALAARRGLAVQWLRPGADRAHLLETLRPALLAWDAATTRPDGPAILQQLHTDPHLSRLPLIVYNHAAAEPANATGVLFKPLPDDALLEAIAGLQPRDAAGSILVVEDDAQTRALHRRIIADHLPGYRVVEAGGGRAALDILARETPSLVLLDLAMPEVDGFAVLDALRAAPRTATVPVLVLSGRTLSAEDIRRLAAARVVFQTKELLSEGELAQSLRQTLAREVLLPPPTSALVKGAIAFIQQHYHEAISRQEIADAVFVSKDYLGRIFQQELGISPGEYLVRYRVLRAKELLRTTSYSVAEVAARVGFDNAPYFSHIFHREVGCTPRAFRQHSIP